MNYFLYERKLSGVLSNSIIAYHGNVQIFQQGLKKNTYSSRIGAFQLNETD